MTLFIQRDAGTSGGSGDTVFPANATLDLTQISNFDLGDGTLAGYGELDPVGNLVQVTYQRSTSGPCPTRLDTVVNTNFGVNSENIDIIVLAVGSGFTLADGTLMAGNGTARPPSSAGNPTRSVLLIYDVEDNNGDGVCLNAQDNGEYDLSSPTPVLLYHELSHAFHIARGDLLSLSEPDPCNDASPEEQRAMQDENDMRTQRGDRLRTTTNHCGNSGVDGSCSSCCVVATVASGSPFSAEVQGLRRVRDGLLRRSEIGFDFFAHLHDDYYGFSPEVCRLMAVEPEVLPVVRDWFVRPLTLCLGLVHAYTAGGVEAEALGQRVVEAVRGSSVLSEATAAELRGAEAILDGESLPPRMSTPGLVALAQLLEARARGREPVEWALVQPIRLMLRAVEWVRAGATANDVGTRLARAIDAWAVDVPLSDVWHGLSRYALREELRFLGRVLLRGAPARRAFASRVLAHLGYRSDVEELLASEWSLEREELR